MTTIIVQPPINSLGEPQPMAYNKDTGEVIVDSLGYVLVGGSRLSSAPSFYDYVSTPKTQTAGIQEAINYVSNLGGGKIFFKNGSYPVNAQIFINASNIEFKGESMLGVDIYPTATIEYVIRNNPLFVIGMYPNGDANPDILSGIIFKNMTIEPVNPGLTSSVQYYSIGGIAPANSLFERLYLLNRSPSQSTIGIGLTGNPLNTDTIRGITIRLAFIYNTSAITIMSGALFSTSTPVSGSMNISDITIDTVYDVQDQPSGDDRIAILGASESFPTFIKGMNITNIHIYVGAGLTSGGINGIKLDTSANSRILDVTITDVWFRYEGTYNNNSTTLPIAVFTGTGATSTSSVSVENLIIKRVYAYGSNQIGIGMGNTSYYYSNPYWILEDITFNNYMSATNQPIAFGFGSATGDGNELIMIKNVSMAYASSVTTPTGVAPIVFQSNNAVTIKHNIRIKNVQGYSTSFTGVQLYNVTLSTPTQLSVGGLRFGNTPAPVVVTDSSGVALDGTPPASFTPSSGTAYQNGSQRRIRVYVPVTLNPTSTAASSVDISIGSSSTAINIPVAQASEPAGLTAGTVQTLVFEVPSGWWFEVSATNAAIGTTVVDATDM